MNIAWRAGEFWYPAVSQFGVAMPFDSSSRVSLRLINNPTYNQMAPLLLSNQGRLVYRRDGFVAEFCEAGIVIDRDVELVEAGDSLRSAWLYARDTYLHVADETPCTGFIEEASYNTWMHAPFDVTQEAVLDYAYKILEQGLKPGILMIDDKWSRAYGDWRFDPKKFVDPRAMIEELHALGFKVMLWVCPYIEPDCEPYQSYVDAGYVLTSRETVLADAEGVYALRWWNGTSACFDMRKAEVVAYWKKMLGELQELGIDGFKCDGGDSFYYEAEHEPDLQSYLWTKLASGYAYQEMRAGYHTADLPVFERLSDRRHEWGQLGLGSLIPSALALGLLGHSIFAPDMIGGGEVNDIREGCKLKQDIFWAHTQMALLMPSMQFSILPSRVMTEDYEAYLELVRSRDAYVPYILEMYKKREPIVRLLEYVFPHEGFECETQIFMLGDRYLVVPVTQEDQDSVELRLPSGSWKDGDKVYEGGSTVTLELSLRVLKVLERIA